MNMLIVAIDLTVIGDCMMFDCANMYNTSYSWHILICTVNVLRHSNLIRAKGWIENTMFGFLVSSSLYYGCLTIYFSESLFTIYSC